MSKLSHTKTDKADSTLIAYFFEAMKTEAMQCEVMHLIV